MKQEKEKERLEEIEGFFRTLEGKTEKYRKSFDIAHGCEARGPCATNRVNWV